MKKNKTKSKAIHEEKANFYNKKISKGERLDFEDFKFLIEIHEEFPFFYKEKMYEIVWGEKGLEFYRNQNLNYTSSIYELYSTGEEFLANVRIDGKTLEEISENIIF